MRGVRQEEMMKMKGGVTVALAVLGPVLLSASGPSDSETLPPPVAVTDQTEVVTNVAIRYHVVQKGEDIYTVAMMWGVSVARLKEENGLTGTELTAGQRLKIHLEDLPVGTSTNLDDVAICGGVIRCNRFGCRRW